MENKRHKELSDKFVEMGKALISESEETGDKVTHHAGGYLVFLAGVILDIEDCDYVTQFCGMFSAKKIMDRMLKNSDTDSKSNSSSKIKSKDSDEMSYEDFIKKLL